LRLICRERAPLQVEMLWLRPETHLTAKAAPRSRVIGGECFFRKDGLAKPATAAESMRIIVTAWHIGP